MPELPHIVMAFLVGLVSGIILSIPTGPVNLTILNEGAQRGFKYAVVVGLGATLMEFIYCSIAFTGIAGFFDHGWVKTAMEIFSFLFMIFLGIKFLLANPSGKSSQARKHLEKKFAPHSAFVTGFIRVLGNPGILLYWIILSASFISREWVRPNFKDKGVCVLSVALGTALWFTGLSYAVSRAGKKFKPATLLLLERGSGVGLLLLGIYHGIETLWRVVHAPYHG